MTNAALVSIILPVYNARSYVALAIASVIDQTFRDWELLVVNDGSTDGSGEIISSFLSDSRIKYFTQTNKGVSAARNVGLSNMHGNFLCFLDADDYLPADSLEKRLGVFFKDSNVVAVDGLVQVFDASLKTVLRQWRPGRTGYVLDSLLKLQPYCFMALTWMVRIAPQHQYAFDEELTHTEDLLFLADVATTGAYQYVDSVTYCYRITPGSAMKDTDRLAKGYRQFLKKVRGKYPDKLAAYDWLIVHLKIRKILFLCYLHDKRILKAFEYLIFGRTV